MTKIALHRVYTYLWLACMALAIAAEWFITWPHRWSIALVALLVVELWAAFSSRKGDTLSEHIYAFRIGWARTPLVVGVAAWLSYRIFTLGTNTPDLGRAALCIGLFGWLVVHWNTEGKDG